MSTCATCSADLRPEWRFCVYCGTATPTVSVGEAEPGATETSGRVNPLAILALVLACIGGFPALIFGHLALRQIRQTGERGRTIARVATALGYLWLVVDLALLVIWALAR